MSKTNDSTANIEKLDNPIKDVTSNNLNNHYASKYSLILPNKEELIKQLEKVNKKKHRKTQR